MHAPRTKKHNRPPKNILRVAVLLMLCCGALSSVTSSAITKGYKSSDPALQPGLVVALQAGSNPNQPTVERASQDQAARVIGVVTTVDDSLVTIASGEQEIFVETGGAVNTFVVNINGEVKHGDLLALSPLKGILMKSSGTLTTMAIALEDFSVQAGQRYAIDDGGQKKDVVVQKIRVNFDKKAFGDQSDQGNSILQQLGRALGARNIGEIRILIALIVFFIVLVAEGGIIYGAISSSITSLGRNPLARNIIRHELVRVLFVAIIVLGLGVAAIYAILWI